MLIARQPILNSSQEVYAYEILFRSQSRSTDSPDFDGNQATAEVITEGIGLMGFRELTGGKKAFINFTGDLLKQEIVSVLPQNLTGIEILEDVKPNREIITVCRKIKDQGYLLVLDDFVFCSELKPLIQLADIIKIDFLNTTPDYRQLVSSRLGNSSITFLAEKVETEKQFREALELNYELFQGYFFSKPEIISRRDLPGFKINYLNLMKEINKAEPDFQKIGELIKKDISLTYMLLRLVNSAYFGFKTEIESVKQSLTLLGIKEIKKWLSLQLMRELGKNKPDILFITALTRAKFAELCAPLINSEHRRMDLYVMGMFSLIDAFFDLPMQKLVEELYLPEDIKQALLQEKGNLGQLLQIIKYYEKGRWQQLDQLSQRLEIATETLSEYYIEAIEDAEQTLELIS
ncbi:MAG: EAL and HDOD domain-containing protein [Bacillota bacterium]